MNFRNCTTSLKDCVPLLANYAALKAQFDWLTDGGITRLVQQNLGSKLRDLEMYIRLILCYYTSQSIFLHLSMVRYGSKHGEV